MKGKVVLITGSSVGIGRETAYKFSQEGAKLAITYNSSMKDGEETEKKCKELGAQDVILVKLDITDSESIKDALRRVLKKYGRIDILINNAGVIRWDPLEKQDFSDIEEQVRTNLEGLIKMTKLALPHVKEAIVNISSGAGKQGFADLTTYCATKFGVRGFTQALAQETKLKVYSVNPGMTKTRMTNFKGVPAEVVADIILNTAKGKYGKGQGDDVDIWKHISPMLWKKYSDVR